MVARRTSFRHQGDLSPAGLQLPVVRLADTTLDEIRQSGFALVEGFLAPDELKAAQEALWLHFPTPEDYFADPARYPDRPGASLPVSKSFPTGRGT